MSVPSNTTAFLSNFSNVGCSEYYYAYSERGYRYCGAPVTDAVIANHANNTQPIAIVPFSGSETRLAAFDVDNHDGEANWSDVLSLTTPLINALREQGLKPFVVRSGGGNGLHIWLIWEQPQNAAHVRRFQKNILAKAGLRSGAAGILDGAVEIYPKQDEVKEGKKGNCIALPFARQSLPLDNDLNAIPLNENTTPDIVDLYSPPLPPDEGNKRSAGNPKQPSSRPENFAVLPGDQEETTSALKHLPADDYDQWVRIGLVLKHVFGEDGFAAWNAWSATSTGKYPGEAECREKWEGFKPTGDVGLGTIFYLAQQEGWNGPSDPVIREMNTRFGILTQGNKTQIIDKLAENENSELLVTLSKESFRDRLKPEKLRLRDDEERGSKAEYWLSHSKAAHYHEIIFDPSLPPGENGNKWNIWAGFAFEPLAGDWDKLKEHIKCNVCSGDEKLYNWIMNWLAIGVQRPCELIGTAPVLIGLPGTGKSFLANAYAKLWDPHAIELTQHSHVSGRFNSHQIGRRFVFIDEGTFGGDKASAGVIKTRITEPYIVFEKKGIDPIRMRNRMIFMVASNEDSVVAADIADRRWMVIKVSASKREDRPYFRAISAQLESGGYAAMLHELLHRDISVGPDPHHIIRTDALFRQILHGLGAAGRYMHQILDEGRLPQSEFNSAGVTTIKALYLEMKTSQPDSRWLTPEALGRWITNNFEGLVQKKQNGLYFLPPRGEHQETERSTEYSFAKLDACRKRFEQIVGQPIIWSDTTEEWPDGRSF